MRDRDKALEVSETVLRHAKNAGADDANVSVENTSESHARFAGNRVTTSGSARNLDITATVWVGRRRGAATGSDASGSRLQQLADEAVQIARVSPVHREYVPTVGPLTYGEDRGYAVATAEIDLDARTRVLASALAACRAAGVTGAGFHRASATATATATANGNRRYFQSTNADFSMTARTADGTGSGYFSADHFDVARVDAEHVVEQAVGKAVRSRDPKTIEPGVYTVILEPQAVADLVGSMTNFDARTADEGRSAFSGKDGKTRVGERLFHESLNLYSDPAHPELPASPSTGEGIPASRLSLISNGTLENLSYSRYWAQEKQVAPTAGPVNFVFESSGPVTPVDEMIRQTRRGLLISRFWYVRLIDQRSLMLTGLTRDGMWMIENGKIVHPVRNLRFNQSVLAMLAPQNVEAVGPSQRKAPLMVPALRLSEFTFTSVSDAI
ncbi:MAG: TldD/PmbA family protein [Acidobacteriota bacterium]|nr:TldD/PmbA family protein [Acidobacteriota bacterium]